MLWMLLVQVIRCFEDDNVIHVAGKVDPVEDSDVINFELALADITQIEKRLERLAKGRAKTKEEAASGEVRPQGHGQQRVGREVAEGGRVDHPSAENGREAAESWEECGAKVGTHRRRRLQGGCRP
jgi:ribosome-binding ATPase YchF (GTP1/OBG family)